MYFPDADVKNVQNPLGYWLSHHAESFDYIPAHDFKDFVAACFAACYIAPENTSMDYGEQEIYAVRDNFLNCMEDCLLSYSGYPPIWQTDEWSQVESDGVWLNHKEEGEDEGVVVEWKLEVVDVDDDCLGFIFSWQMGMDDAAYWIHKDAVADEEQIKRDYRRRKKN